VKCEGCGASLPKDARYCHECGRRVERRRKLLKVIPLMLTAALTIQLATILAEAGRKPVDTLLMEAGYPHYREGGDLYAVVGQDPLHVEAIARIAEKASRGLGFSTCYAPGDGFRPPPSLEAETYTGRRLASAVDEVWAAAMGRARGVDVLYNGTHAVVTMTVDGLDPLAVTSALSRASADTCVRVLMR